MRCEQLKVLALQAASNENALAHDMETANAIHSKSRVACRCNANVSQLLC